MRVPARSVALLVVAAGGLAGAPVRAGEGDHTARLLYARGDGASSCPDENDLRNTVSARLGYDPFRDEAARTVAASIARKGRGLHAIVELRDAAGTVTGSRELDSNTTDCTELASAVSLALSIAIDPLTLSRPAAPPPPTPPPTPPAQPPAPMPVVTPPPAPPSPPKIDPPSPAPPAPAPRTPVGLRVSAGALVSFGVSPATAAIGFAAQLGFRVGRFSLGIEGRADLPSTGDTPYGRIETQLLGAQLVPCFHHWWLQGCALVFAGALRGRAIDATPIPASTLYLAGGARLGLEIPLWRALGARVHADLLAPLLRRTLAVQSGDESLQAWTTPVVGGGLGVDLLGRF